MAVLASKPQFSSLGVGSSQPAMVSQYASSYRKPVGSGDSHSANQTFRSPTESEFSVNDGVDDSTSIKSWDEKKVCEWLRKIHCSQYEPTFRGMHIHAQLSSSIAN